MIRNYQRTLCALMATAICVLASPKTQSEESRSVQYTEQAAAHAHRVDTHDGSPTPESGDSRPSLALKDGITAQEARPNHNLAIPDKGAPEGSDSTEIKHPPKPEVSPQALTTGENKTGVSAQSISVPTGPGTIEGMGESFSTQPSTGIAGFNIPISLPAPRGAVQPALGIGYSSAGGSGLLGMGWNVGVGAISRHSDRGIPRYLDQNAWHPQQDRFIFNGGQELVPIQELLPGELLPVWADSNWQYFRARVEGSFQRFFWNRSQKLWRVQDQSGVVAEFGVVGTETDAIETAPGETSKVYSWNLKRQIDSYGNEVRYYYDFKDANTTYLTDIYYTKPAGALGTVARDAWAYHVKLSYEPREDHAISYRRGWETQQRYRLASIEVSGKDNASDSTRRRIRKYSFSYIKGSHTLLLSSVQMEGRCAEALPGEKCTLPPMRFGYTHVKTNAAGAPVFVDGFESIDSTVHSMV